MVSRSTASMVVILPGLLISAGVGACQPNCKSGAMLDVSDEMSATAASLLKLLQLLWVALMQAGAGAVAGNAATAVRSQSILLAGVCTLGLIWLSASRADTRIDIDSAALQLQKHDQTAAGTCTRTVDTAIDIDTAGDGQ